MGEKRGYNNVRLLRGYKGLNAGEVGGFPTSEAQKLLSDGHAQPPNAKYPPDHDKDAPLPPAHAGDPVAEEFEETAVIEEAASAENPLPETRPRSRGRGRGAPEATA